MAACANVYKMRIASTPTMIRTASLGTSDEGTAERGTSNPSPTETAVITIAIRNTFTKFALNTLHELLSVRPTRKLPSAALTTSVIGPPVLDNPKLRLSSLRVNSLDGARS
jgi:hypothetical protein